MIDMDCILLESYAMEEMFSNFLNIILATIVDAILGVSMFRDIAPNIFSRFNTAYFALLQVLHIPFGLAKSLTWLSNSKAHDFSILSELDQNRGTALI